MWYFKGGDSKLFAVKIRNVDHGEDLSPEEEPEANRIVQKNSSQDEGY